VEELRGELGVCKREAERQSRSLKKLAKRIK
jgi:hypothetical protein